MLYQEMFIEFSETTKKRIVIIGDGKNFEVLGTGIVDVYAYSG